MDWKYEMIIYWSNEDLAYIVEVPELPGCMADGRTYQEAVSNAEIFITQGEAMQEIEENLIDIYKDLANGHIPCIHKVDELKVA